MEQVGMVPKRMFLTRGMGHSASKLGAFEAALRLAGIQGQNLVCVSSIMPPGCEIISKEEGACALRPGAITFVVMSRAESDELGELVTASIGLAIPADSSRYGYLSEYEAHGETEEAAGEKAEESAATMLASILGVDFDANSDWSSKRNALRLSGKIVKTSHITQSAKVAYDDAWTCAIAAAVFMI